MAIAAGNAGAWAAVYATTQTVTLPTHAAGTQLILIAACKATTPASLDIQITTPATGWEKIAQFADGTTGSGVGTGSVTQAVFRRICQGAGETNPVVTWGGSQTASPGIAVAVGFTKASDEVWLYPAVVQAATNNATSISVTMGSNPGIGTGDFGLAVHTTRDDSALTVPTWTATGTTLGTATVFPATPIASGTSDDMAGTLAYRSVTGGIATAAPVVTATQAAAETGVTSFIRLRTGNITPNRKLLSATRNTTGTSTVASGSVTVTAGNTIFVAAASFVNSAFGTESVTDNLGNTYSVVIRLRRAGDSERLALYAAPVTVAGTMTTLTYNHDSSQFVGIVAIEYAGVGAISGSAYSGDGNGTTNTWLSSSSIPAGGAAIGGTMNSATTDTSAGAASGSPSTTIVEADGWSTTGMGATIFHALAPAAVTGFTGTATTVGAVDWVGTGAVYSTIPSVTATPTTLALTITKFAPTVTATAGTVVTPTTAALATVKFAPVIKLAVIVPTKALTLTTFAPTVRTPILATPPTKALTLMTFAPTVTATANQRVTPTTLALSLTTFAPTIRTPILATPTTKALTLTTFAPVIRLAIRVTPTTAALTLTTFAPTVSVGAGSVTVTPITKALTLTTFAPVVSTPQRVTPTTRALVLTKFAPTVHATANLVVTPTTRALILTRYAPTVRVNQIVIPSTKALTLATFAPTVSATTNVLVRVGTASLVLTRYAPTIDTSANKLVVPVTAALVLTTYQPSVEVHSLTPLPRIVTGTVVIAHGPGATVAPRRRGSTTVVVAGRPSARVSR